MCDYAVIDDISYEPDSKKIILYYSFGEKITWTYNPQGSNSYIDDLLYLRNNISKAHNKAYLISQLPNEYREDWNMKIIRTEIRLYHDPLCGMTICITNIYNRDNYRRDAWKIPISELYLDFERGKSWMKDKINSRERDVPVEYSPDIPPDLRE